MKYIFIYKKKVRILKKNKINSLQQKSYQFEITKRIEGVLILQQ